MPFQIQPKYLREPESIPEFWLSTVDDVTGFVEERVEKGRVETMGRSAGGRRIRKISYGTPRRGRGTTTYSGALGFRRNVGAYLGPDRDRKVYLGVAAVHGGEFEGIVGMVNLLSVLETGRDLRGKEWPGITAAMAKLDRVIIIPILNVDGRSRVPIRMAAHRGEDSSVHEYLNTGCWKDGTLIGWPHCKEFIPLDFAKTEFPGGYPNDAGVNIQHDDFLGDRQPETQALFDLVAAERPDLIINMHTGAPPRNYYTRMHRPFCEPAMEDAFIELYRRVHTDLALAGLQGTKDPEVEADGARQPRSVYNLDTALNLHCGALSALVEAPSHNYAGLDRQGNVVYQSPEMILDAQLVVHQAGMTFLAETGGRIA